MVVYVDPKTLNHKGCILVDPVGLKVISSVLAPLTSALQASTLLRLGRCSEGGGGGAFWELYRGFIGIVEKKMKTTILY